jgi:hypothetical protein
VRDADPLIVPDAAVIVARPSPTLEARPELLTLATVAADEIQLAEFVKVCVLPSLKVPVAENCCVVSCGMLALGGATARETRTGGVTVKLDDPEILPDIAVIVVPPCATDEANPALLMLATLAADEFHVTEDVRFCVLPLV